MDAGISGAFRNVAPNDRPLTDRTAESQGQHRRWFDANSCREKSSAHVDVRLQQSSYSHRSGSLRSQCAEVGADLWLGDDTRVSGVVIDLTAVDEQEALTELVQNIELELRCWVQAHEHKPSIAA